MPGFFGKRMEEAAEKRAKKTVDKELGANDGGDEDDSGEEEGRGRKLFRRLSDRFRGRSSSGSSNEGQRVRKLKKSSDSVEVKTPRSDGSATPNADGSNSDFVDTETPVNTNSASGSDQDNFSDGTADSRAGSDWQSGSTMSDQSDHEELQKRQKKDERRLLEMRPDDSAAYNPKTKAEFTVRVRIIEAKELQGENLNPLVRVNLAGKTRTTRSIRTTSNPYWDQTVGFTLRTSIEELAMQDCDFNVYSAGSLLRKSLIGTFSINLGVVYKSKQQAIVEKWLALMPDDADSGAEIRGFLKVSISVFHANQLPPLLSRHGGAGDDDVLYRAQLLNYCLRFRIFKISQLADHIRFPYKKTPKAEGKVALEISVGPYKAITKFMRADNESLYFGQELQVPIMWPTVIKQIRFRLIIENSRRRKRVVCTEFLNLRQLCQPGEHGFLPTFGPSFISFYGPEHGGNIWKRLELNQIRDGKQQGTHYCGRAHFELTCEESTIQHTFVVDMPLSTIKTAEKFHQPEHFTLFCGFFSANLIHPDFKSKAVQFVVSIGEFGNVDYNKVLSCTNRTLPVMPAYDTTCAYTMPWGNQKPVCEILCDFEDIGWRFETTNVLLKIANMLSERQEEVATMSESNPEECELASIVVGAIEEAAECFNQFVEIMKQPKSRQLTSLDILLKKARLNSLHKLYGDFADFKFEQLDPNEMSEYAIRQLGVFAQQLREIAADPQLSIPDIVLHMVVDGSVVGHARIPPTELYFGQSQIRCGQHCGQVRVVPLSWPTSQTAKPRGHELPCILHLKAWFGKSKWRNSWLEQLKPAAINYYAELFYNEKRSPFSSNWKETGKNPFTVSDETGLIELSEGAVKPPAGWEFKNVWTPMRCHDMWVGPEAGHTTFDDEFFEVQKKDPLTQEWLKHACTGFYGEALDRTAINNPPPGWKFESEWTIDFHGAGDADGWQYSLDENFWEDPTTTVDSVERQTHLFRRRRYTRRRRFASDNATVLEMYEDIRIFAKNLNDEGWEYAQKWGVPTHFAPQPEDRFRRRRLVRELVAANAAKTYKLAMGVMSTRIDMETNEKTEVLQTFSPRIYEVHAQTSVFQLRAYVLWARELHSPKKHVSRAFVRVFFLNRCQQTCVVESSMNPIWNETLLFDRFLIPGGTLALQTNPPSAIIECHGEEINGKPVFLGRFEVKPIVIGSLVDTRSQPTWHPLRFSNNKTRGAILMNLELFQADPTTKHIVPAIPVVKQGVKTARYEVPPDVRPVFTKYTVQIMAWGVRNLPRYQLLSVRSPFVEITVADRRDRTDIIDDTSINPNFTQPLLTFADVLMPKSLSYASPIVLNLHDRRTFGRQPLIGTCIVKDFQRFMRSPPPKRDAKRVEADWDAFDAHLAKENILQLKEFNEMRLHEPNDYPALPDDPNSPRIDWWSKYFYSKGQEEKAHGYQELGLEKLRIYKCPLENVGEYNGFADFLDTFIFVKPTKNSLGVDPTAEKRGELKGKLFITRQDDKKLTQLAPSGVEFDGPVECVVRVYIVRAFDLHARRRSGQCDPYITIRCGNKKKYKGQKEYVPDTLEPIFGQCVEMELTIPQQKDLTISVMDRRLMFTDNEIGSTTIDLENRLLTKFRATVGLPGQYNVIGPLPWRDQLNPLQTLRRYCTKMNLPPPKVLRPADSKDVGIELVGHEFWLSEIERGSPPNLNLAGRPLHRIALHILRMAGLVPEHVETRPLYNSVNPDMECGMLEMFVDIFPKPISDKIPPAIDITPRRPKAFQLRVAVFGLRNVILQKKSLGRPAADLYVRCYLNGMPKSERTDIHYRCIDGAASFNWRFVFDLEYDVFERQIMAYKKKRLFRKRASELVDPILVIEIWDNNKFKRDKYIGQCLLNLLGFEEGQIDEDEMDNVKYDKEAPLRTCCAVCSRSAVACWRTRCCTKKQRKKDLVHMPRAPRYIPGQVGELSLFQQRSAAGWWPCTSSVLPKKQRDDRKKNDQREDDDAKPGEEIEYVTGMVEMELNLLPIDEALENPVGRKRKKPNHSPHLPSPDRPKMDSFWCTSRLKAGSRICWNKCGGWSCVWFTLMIILFVVFTAVLIWKLPNILVDKLL